MGRIPAEADVDPRAATESAVAAIDELLQTNARSLGRPQFLVLDNPELTSQLVERVLRRPGARTS